MESEKEEGKPGSAGTEDPGLASAPLVLLRFPTSYWC